jgi:hypothetical protein
VKINQHSQDYMKVFEVSNVLEKPLMNMNPNVVANALCAVAVAEISSTGLLLRRSVDAAHQPPVG